MVFNQLLEDGWFVVKPVGFVVFAIFHILKTLPCYLTMLHVPVVPARLYELCQSLGMRTALPVLPQILHIHTLSAAPRPPKNLPRTQILCHQEDKPSLCYKGLC